MSSLTIKKCVLRILLQTIPTYLINKLELIYEKVLHLKRLQRLSQGMLEDEHRIYDLVNCGPMNQFMVKNLVVHNSSYGAGTGKLYEVLTLDGVGVTWDQVSAMRDSYWQLYRGVKDYESRLTTEWQDRNGWVYNGLKRPLSIQPDLVRDVLNRVIQSTGHDILMMYLYYINKLRNDLKVNFNFVICDYHDETIVECKEEDADKVINLFNSALLLTNEELNGTIRLRSKPKKVLNLYEAKGD
jgi:hypothetical protein